MSEHPVQNGDALDEVSFMQAQLEATEIPPNVDPHLLALWFQREQDKIERKKRKFVKPPKQYGRSLVRLFPAYIGITVMCLAVILGLIQGQEPDAILKTTCVAFLVYTIFGFFIGMVAEWCVNESVETLLRDVVNRGRATTHHVETESSTVVADIP
jgi:hypothetical protein